MRVTSPRIFGLGVLRTLKASFKLALLAGLLGGAGWGARMGFQAFFIDNEEFQLRDIELETNGRITEKEVAEVTGLDLTASVFAIRLAEIREKLEARPGVKRVEVTRRLPGTLRLTVEERVPVAWLECRPLGIRGRDPDTGLLVDARGFCFRCDPWWKPAAAGLPVVVLSEATEDAVIADRLLCHHEGRRALHLLQLSRRLLASREWSIEVVAVRNDYALLAATSEGIWATFGMYDHQRQLADLVALRDHAARSDRVPATVNLIPERNIPVCFANPGRNPAHPMRRPAANRLERDIEAVLDRG